jgi:hypothetical protein
MSQRRAFARTTRSLKCGPSATGKVGIRSSSGTAASKSSSTFLLQIFQGVKRIQDNKKWALNSAGIEFIHGRGWITDWGRDFCRFASVT